MEFDSVESAKAFYYAYASQMGFSARKNRSRRSRRDESIIMRRFVCTREGYQSRKESYGDGKGRRKRTTQRPETLNKFFKKYFNTKTSILTFITQFGLAMEAQREKEMQADAITLYTERVQKTPSTESSQNFQESLTYWYNDLCLDAMKYGVEGAASVEIYKVAKQALQKAFAEVSAAKSMHRRGQQHLQRFVRAQKISYKRPLPKLPQKRTSAGGAQRSEDNNKRGNKTDDSNKIEEEYEPYLHYLVIYSTVFRP
ncbi:Protein FAR1-RELATED SEQUENCE 9 [Acorus gramineus]|uniref:Protein FAR1-RELATED SEQUENCE n=1 Tax=Acorus gramineus TaxID=55184 RepID=A0AAV9BCI2_ACOGR|nr:Protein FAR1-RELATED SEQUENCE 9 [Acorus gramineus]